MMLAQIESHDYGTTIITGLIIIAIFLGVFLLIRSIMLWYWKVDTIVANQELQTQLLKKLEDGSNKRDARANYYKAIAINDNNQAYEQLLYIVFYDLTNPDYKLEDRKANYERLKTTYTQTFESLGRSFPDYPF